MNNPRFFAFLTFFLIAASGTTIAFHKFFDDDFSRVKDVLTNPSRALPQLASGSTPAQPIEEQKVEISEVDFQNMVAALPRVQSIPWLKSEVASAFRDSSGRNCRLLPPGTAVTPYAETPRDGQMLEQRMTALLIGLRMDTRAKSQLPSLSKSMIESYLDDHLLAIQPSVFIGKEVSAFSGSINSAFYDRKFPQRTIQSEPMIQQAVSEFRVLGIYDANGKNNGVNAQTIVLAYRFVKEDLSATSLTKPEVEYELLFLNLIKNDNEKPELVVFATDQGRELFQELEISDPSSPTAHATVTATIRFEDFTMMGLYPANPIVTGVHNRVLRTIPVSQIRDQIDGRGGNIVVPLPELLKRLHNQPPDSAFTTLK